MRNGLEVHCFRCLHADTKVLDSRLSHDGFTVRRRRSCTECGHRFTTYEKQENEAVQVRKKDGSFEPFSIDKLVHAMTVACSKRRISPQKIEAAANDIFHTLLSKRREYIDSDFIGDLASQALKELDQVAYVRFSSIYKDFKDIDAFNAEIEKIKQQLQASEDKKGD